jgi:hypothetical protein
MLVAYAGSSGGLSRLTIRVGYPGVQVSYEYVCMYAQTFCFDCLACSFVTVLPVCSLALPIKVCSMVVS